MVVLGLIVLVLSVGLAAAVAVANPDSAPLEAFGEPISGLTLGGVLLIGVGLGALAMLGLSMMMAGARRKRARKLALKREVAEVRDEHETLAEENSRLQAELERKGSAAPYPADDATSAQVENDSSRGRHAR